MIDPDIRLCNDDVLDRIIRCQRIVMRDFGISVPHDDLVRFAANKAESHHDFDPEDYLLDTLGDLLKAVGIEVEKETEDSIFNLIWKLNSGKRAIICMEVKREWDSLDLNTLQREFLGFLNKHSFMTLDPSGEQAVELALAAVSMNVNPDDPNERYVVVTDSDPEEEYRTYPVRDFCRGWIRCEYLMVSSYDQPKYQYNPLTDEIEPSSFETNYYPDAVKLPSSLQNDFRLPDDYYEKYDESLLFDPPLSESGRICDTSLFDMMRFILEYLKED